MADETRTTTARFAGLGTAADGQWVFQCGPDNTAAGSNNEDYLAEHPKVSPASVGILDAIGKGGGVTLEFVYDDSAEPVQALARTEVTFARDSNNAVGRVSEFTDSSATTIPTDVDLSGTLSGGDYIWFGSEAAIVSSVSSSSITVTRAALGSTPSDLPRQSLGMVIMTAAPPIAGRAVTVKESTGSDASETTIFQGIVTDVRPAAGGNPSRLTVAAQSRMRDLFGGSGRTWYAPRSENELSSMVRTNANRIIWSGYPSFAFRKTREFGALSASYLRIFNDDGQWAVVEVDTGTGPDSDNFDYYAPAAAPNIVQIGEDDRIAPVDQWGEIFPANVAFTGRAEWVAVYTSPVTPYGLLYDLLLGDSTWPWGVSLGLSTTDVDTVSLRDVMTRALPFNLRSNHIGANYAGTVDFVLPWFQPDEKIGEIIKKEILAPAFVGLLPTANGQIGAIDWRNVLVPDGTLSQSNITSGPIGEVSQSRGDVLRDVTIKTEHYGGKLADRVISEYASAIHATGRAVSFPVRVYAAHLTPADGTTEGPLKRRARGVIASYERAPRVGGFMTRKTVTADVGDVLSVSCDDLPAPSGVRGSSAERFLITERGKEKGGEVRLAGAFLGTDIGARWAPVAEVSSYSSGTITVKDDGRFTASDDATSPAAYFEVGDYVILLDQYGTEKVGTATEITGISGDDISDLSAFSTAVDGDLIVLADYDETGQDNTWAWQADDSAELGSAGDDAKVWT